MPTRQNRYFNNPQMAAAFSNLAGVFAPPSAQDFYAQSRTEGQDFQNQAIADAYGAMTAEGVTPQDQDRFGVAATLFGQGFNPTQTNRAVDIASGDRRYGTDVGAATAMRGQNLDLAQAYATNNLTGDQAIPGLSPEIAEALGLGFDLPAVSGQGIGAPATPLTETQVAGADRQRLQGDGLLTDEMLLAEIMGTTPVENIVTPEGPRVAYRTDAVGQEPFINRGAEAAAKPITYTNAAGQRVGGMIRDGQFFGADGAPLTPEEAGTAVNIGQPQGSNDELGVTNSNMTDYNRVQQTVTVSNLLLDDLEGLIRSQAGAAGLPGTIQSLGQDLLQVGRELGTAFGGDENALVTPDMLAGVAGDGSGYNPVFREIRTGLLQLAYLNAQRDNPRGEVSRFALERQIEALGQGAIGNDQSTLAALGMTRRANERALAGADASIGRSGQPSPVTQGGATPPPAALQMLQSNPTAATRAQFDEVFGPGAAARALGE